MTSKSYPARNKNNPPLRNEVSVVKHYYPHTRYGRVVFKRGKCTPLRVEQTIGYYDNKDFEDVADEDTAWANGESGMTTYLKAGEHLRTKTCFTHDSKKTCQSIPYVTKCINALLLIFYHVA